MRWTEVYSHHCSSGETVRSEPAVANCCLSVKTVRDEHVNSLVRPAVQKFASVDLHVCVISVIQLDDGRSHLGTSEQLCMIEQSEISEVTLAPVWYRPGFLMDVFGLELNQITGMRPALCYALRLALLSHDVSLRSTSSHFHICRSTSSHLHICRSTSSHLHILQIYIFTLSHLQIYMVTPSHPLIYIFTPSYLQIHIFTPSHLQIYIFTPFTSADLHHHTFISADLHLHTFTPADLHLPTFTSADLLPRTFTSADLLSLSLPFFLSLFFPSLSKRDRRSISCTSDVQKLKKIYDFTYSPATLSHEMDVERQKLR